ncbi:MAG: hypothetical protein FWC73_11935 [Defluviitaleaceae bacterium]|nr:hypothetical protein [Defluviitaleaceae bacterium]
MNSIISTLMTASFVGTILFLIILALRPITGRLFSKTWHYYLGIIPIFFFLGGVSAVHFLADYMNVTAPFFGAASELYVLSQTYYSEVNTMPLLLNAGQPIVSDYLPIMHRARELLSIRMASGTIIFFTLAWAVGAILYIAVNFHRYRTYRWKLLQHSRPCRGIQSPLPVVISCIATTPMVIGFIKPVIILPDIALSGRELEMILAHELTHFARGDAWLKLVTLIAKSVHWFNPGVHALSRYMHNLCESSCDEKVVMEMSTQERKHYGEAILSMLQHGSTQRSLICASGLCNSHKNVKRRLFDMLNAKKTRKFMVAISLVMALAIAGVGGVVAHGFRNAMVYEEDCYAPANIIPSGEIIDNDITVAGSIALYGQVNGAITIPQGSLLIISGNGVVNGTVIVEGELLLEENGVITGAGSRGVVINPGGEFTMTGGYIQGNSYSENGGGVWVNNGIFTMNGGLIQYNSSYNGGGGGVWISGPETRFAIYSGYIQHNHSYGPGGGVFLTDDADFAIYGGMVVRNNASNIYS